jgi:hypothetical protein
MHVSELTRRDIIDYLILQKHPFCGRLELTEFLGRIWDLTSMPSTDFRFQNALEDIWQHMINNSDWDDEYLLWRYLELGSCDDETFLRFLETCLHPMVVNDEGVITELLTFFNEKLKPDGYQLQKSKSISGRAVYAAVDIGSKAGNTIIIGQDFWIGFIAYLQILTDKDYLCNCFPGYCSDGHPIGRDDRQVQLVLQQELGQVKWPFQPEVVPDTEIVLRIVEFFFRYVAKPTESLYHSYCGNAHPTEFDIGKGRYEYTIEINRMFTRFKHPFKLQKGRVTRTGSMVLDTGIISGEFNITCLPDQCVTRNSGSVSY